MEKAILQTTKTEDVFVHSSLGYNISYKLSGWFETNCKDHDVDPDYQNQGDHHYGVRVTGTNEESNAHDHLKCGLFTRLLPRPGVHRSALGRDEAEANEKGRQ
ncbi:hypothetical protein SARC_09243 [Sphaeroforma arctica JP610]|uniref:Uncharacterized protein n=1 Tax=Sphaeroforma arctica JP610 TaxID=667725 RepID=A0A0L0FNL4_9EUKA|nr:hypothetical protein SARC_09243 [Sphaeroforma arctica JP610]KNC78319.1 hypothetical protein SARC_09243 [Sphaeroforma arctica JP610]|eukprot:XP_014152221.1 hypothetical protein SARC_09243 [Sphaeroforma arctica JP610]